MKKLFVLISFIISAGCCFAQSITIKAINGYISINSTITAQPFINADYPSNAIAAIYSTTDTVSVALYNVFTKEKIITLTPYSRYINGVTGLAFTSMASFKTYARANFFAEAGSSTGDSVLIAGKANKPVGLLYNKAYWTALTDFTTSGFTPTVSNSGITFTGGSNTYTQTMIINGFTSTDPNIDVEVAYTVGSTGHGIGIGRKSLDVEASCVVQYDETASTLIFTSLQGNTVLATQPANFTISNGDYCILRYSQKGNIVTGTFTDLSRTGSSFSYSVPLQTAGYNYPIPNSSDVCLYNIGGTRTIQSISYKSRSLYRPDIVFNGDSKTVGLQTYGPQFRWANQLAPLGSSEVYAGGGDKVADLLAGAPYIINYIKPKAILINVLRNDLSGGTLSSANKTNYEALVSAYQAAGITVYHLLPIPETAIADQSAITTFLEATYPGSSIIDPSTGAVSFNTSTMNAADGIHLNVLGNTVVAANILNAAKMPLSGNVNPFIPLDPLLTYPIVYATGYIPYGQGTNFLAQSGGLNFNNTNNRLGVGITYANVAYGIDMAGNFRQSGNNLTIRQQQTLGTDNGIYALPTTAGNFASDSQIDDMVIDNATSGKSTRFAFSGGASVHWMTSTSDNIGLGIKVGVTEGANGRVGQVALVAGTKAITISGLTTSSRAFITLVTPGSTSLTTAYQAVCTNNTLTLQANIAAGTINTADTSTLNYFIIN